MTAVDRLKVCRRKLERGGWLSRSSGSTAHTGAAMSPRWIGALSSTVVIAGCAGTDASPPCAPDDPHCATVVPLLPGGGSSGVAHPRRRDALR